MLRGEAQCSLSPSSSLLLLPPPPLDDRGPRSQTPTRCAAASTRQPQPLPHRTLSISSSILPSTSSPKPTTFLPILILLRSPTPLLPALPSSTPLPLLFPHLLPPPLPSHLPPPFPPGQDGILPPLPLLHPPRLRCPLQQRLLLPQARSRPRTHLPHPLLLQHAHADGRAVRHQRPHVPRRLLPARHPRRQVLSRRSRVVACVPVRVVGCHVRAARAHRPVRVRGGGPAGAVVDVGGGGGQ